MNKKFMISLGMGWCGSTSLWNTLKINGYIDTGISKEIHALCAIDDFYFNENFFNFKSRNENLLFNKRFGTNYEKNPTKKVIDTYNQLTIENFDEDKKILYNYINYIDAISETTKSKYAADFSNTNANLSTNILLKLKNLLEKNNYDVKIVCVLRDPVRSGFSELQHHYSSKKRKDIILQDYIQRHMSASCGFITSIDNYENVFGSNNVWVGFMEEFFDPQKSIGKFSVSGLEKFLEEKLEVITPCVYVPDKGINAPDLPGLRDQSTSDKIKLTPKMYWEYKKLLQPEYDAFENKYGFVPDFWGSPIDYGY